MYKHAPAIRIQSERRREKIAAERGLIASKEHVRSSHPGAFARTACFSEVIFFQLSGPVNQLHLPLCDKYLQLFQACAIAHDEKKNPLLRNNCVNSLYSLRKI